MTRVRCYYIRAVKSVGRTKDGIEIRTRSNIVEAKSKREAKRKFYEENPDIGKIVQVNKRKC